MEKGPAFEIIISSDGIRQIRCNRPIELIATIVEDEKEPHGFRLEYQGDQNPKLAGVLKRMADWYHYQGRKNNKSDAKS